METVYHNNQNKFITLANLSVSNIPEKLKFRGDEFIVKSEFHITLLAVRQIAEIIDPANTEKLQLEIVQDFYQFVDVFPLTNYELQDEVRLVTVGNNKTIVKMAKLEGIEKLFNMLEKKYQKKLPVQPTHVTLYTLPTDTFGIPILSYEQLENISIPVTDIGLEPISQ